MDVGILIGIMGSIVSIAGIIFAVYSQKQSQKKERQYEYLFKLADLNIDKNITAQSIQELKKQMTIMENKVKKEIPFEARKTILKDKLNDSYLSLLKYRNEVVELKTELESLNVQTDIPISLLKEIENEIHPKYLKREKISKYQLLLTLFSASAAVSFAIPIYPFNRMIGMIFAFFAIIPIIYLVKYFITNIKLRNNRKLVLNITIMLLSCIATIFFITSIFLFYVFISFKNDEVNWSIFYIGIGILLLSFTIAFITYILYSKLQNTAVANIT